MRIWSAGCATGAEPYSVAILLRRDLAAALEGWDVTIVGTDINRAFLARAGSAIFEEWALRATPEDVRRDCFTRSGKEWTLRPSYQEGVSFQYHNLVSHTFPSLVNNLFAFDLILCRNVMIYFNQDIMGRVLAGFHQSLVEGGWLLVGHAEPSVQLFRAFRAVNAPGGPVFYQKVSESAEPETRIVAPTVPSTEYQVPSTPQSASCAEHSVLSTQYSVPSTGNPIPRPEIAAHSSDLSTLRALADRGAWEEALANCVQLLETDRLNPLVHFYHGLVLEQVGSHDEAEAALRRSLYLDRRSALAHYYLGLLLQKGHRVEQAILSFKNALRLLGQLDGSFAFDDGDGITAAELAKLTRMQLAVLEGT